MKLGFHADQEMELIQNGADLDSKSFHFLHPFKWEIVTVSQTIFLMHI